MSIPRVSFVFAAVLAVFAPAAPARAASFYTARPDDPRAVYLTPDAFPVHGDGVADDTAALQAAIDKVQETTGEGIVFVPAGRYRVTNTIDVWPGIRVIGYGATRPVLVLAPGTPGYGDPAAEKYLVFFAGNRPGAGRGGGRGGTPAAGPARATPPGAAPAPVAPAGAPAQGAGRAGRGGNNGQPGDAGAGTFYSAMSNVDIEIGDGNAGAVGVRGRYAQHSFLAHMDFQIGSGLAGIHNTGNIAEDLHVHGGRSGVWTLRPSPGWQYTMVDASFDGQRVAAIFEREAGLTLVRPMFTNVPTAVSIEPGHADELWMKDGRMENISGPAVIISNEKNGTNILVGIGLYTNGINPRAVAAKWMAGTNSMHERRALPRRPRHEQHRRQRGRIPTTTPTPPIPTSTAAGTASTRASGSPTAAAAPSSTSGRRARSRRPACSCPNTSTPGRVYEMSSEHHVRHEVQLDRVVELGASTRCRPKKSAARAASHCRSRSTARATSRSRTSTSTA